MADVAILARHLFMSEVLEICESVHKLMEEKQLTVYKKGEVQTVASTIGWGLLGSSPTASTLMITGVYTFFVCFIVEIIYWNKLSYIIFKQQQ